MAETIIIIPTYNERENIEKLISNIFRHAPDVNVLIVDDNSPDGTGIIADKIARSDSRVSVMHRAVRRERSVDGFKAVLKRRDIRYIMEMDADFTHDPKYIQNFIKEAKYNDIVIGSRFVEGGSDIERSFFRRCFSRTVNYFIRKYLGIKIRDCTSGYKCFKRRVLESINLDLLVSNGPAIIEEILYIVYFKRYKIKEIPVILKKRERGISKLGFKKLLKVLMDMLAFKRAHLPEKKKKEIKELRRFGFGLALGLNIAGCVMFYREKAHFIWFTDTGSLVLVFAIAYPVVLCPIKKILDAIILWIGKIANTVTLLIVFYLIFSPIGILLRLFQKDILSKKLDKSVSSYWIKKNKSTVAIDYYERMG